MIGTKLAHYEITSHLGSGGMGGVYQATDSKLGALAMWAAMRPTSPKTEPLMRFNVDMRPQAVLGPVATVVLSPDGTYVAYTESTTGGGRGVFVRRLDQPEGTQLAP